MVTLIIHVGMPSGDTQTSEALKLNLILYARYAGWPLNRTHLMLLEWYDDFHESWSIHAIFMKVEVYMHIYIVYINNKYLWVQSWYQFYQGISIQLAVFVYTQLHQTSTLITTPLYGSSLSLAQSRAICSVIPQLFV